MSFASLDVKKISKIDKKELYNICINSYMYYKTVKTDSSIPPKFLEHLKKMGIYVKKS